MGPHPVFSAVVLLLLLLHPLLEHLLDLLLGEQLVKPGLLLVPVGIVPQDIRTVQPVQQLLRHLLLKGDVLEVLEKTAVEAVEIRLTLHQKRPAQVVEAGEAGAVQPLLQGLHQGHPFGEGDLQPAPPESIEKFLKHGLTSRSAAGRPCPRSSSAAPPDRAPPSPPGWGPPRRGPGPGSSR